MVDIGPISKSSSIFKSINIVQNIDQKNVKTIAIADSAKLLNEINDGKKSDVKELIEKYDLRNIDGSDVSAFIQLLRDKKAMSEETANILYGEMFLVFEDKPIGTKLDVISHLENRLESIKGYENEIGDVGISIMKLAVNTANSIENARKNKSGTIKIDQYV
jgi:hypothetical protein